MRVIAGRYELRRLLGRGGMGEVWEAHDRTMARTVAVKLMPRDPDDRHGADQFRRGARTAGGLRHPGVVTVHDVGTDEAEGLLYLVMEHVTGRDLARVLRDSGPQSVADVVDWAVQIADILDTAHTAGVVHRDLKPANLMLTDRGRIVILDFGIARFLESSASTRSSSVMGTLGYMAPERFDEAPGDARSDLYALGCILTELLTGELPFEAGGPVAMMKAHLYQVPRPAGEKRPGIPAALDEVVAELLAKDPDDRPATAAEVRERLRVVSVPTENGGPRGLAAASKKAERLRKTASERKTAIEHKTASAGKTAPMVVPSTVAVHGAVDKTAHTPVIPHSGRTPVSRRRLLTTAAIATAVVGAGSGAIAFFAGGGTSANGTSPKVKWKIPIPAGVTSTPRVADGVAYLSCHDGSLAALDAATGVRKWAFTAPSALMVRAAVGQGLAYVADRNGTLYALDTATGAQRWSLPTGAGVYACDPVFADGRVYVSNLDGTLCAVHADSGALLWKSPVTETSLNQPQPLAVAGGTVFALGADGALHAFAASSGAKLWSGGTGFTTAPAVADGIVYIADVQGVLHALTASTGVESWKCATPGVPRMDSIQMATVGDLIVDHGTAYLLADVPCAINLGSRTLSWQYKDDGSSFYGSTMALAGGIVYATAYDTILALESATGAVAWTHTLGDRGAMTVAAIDDHTILVKGYEDDLFAIAAPQPRTAAKTATKTGG
jgi:serine/threonine-protein kinase